MQSPSAGRGVEIATALMLGIVSVVTALGALQASLWSGEAGALSADAADARDQHIALAVSADIRQRGDLRNIFTAAMRAIQQDEAIAAGDEGEVLRLESEIHSEIEGLLFVSREAFDEWRAADYPDDAIPINGASYLVESGRGDADALLLTSQRLSELSDAYASRAGTFTQAALVHALSLFLFGVAGINRLRLARYVTLVAGLAVFLFGLFFMSTAY